LLDLSLGLLCLLILLHLHCTQLVCIFWILHLHALLMLVLKFYFSLLGLRVVLLLLLLVLGLNCGTIASIKLLSLVLRQCLTNVLLVFLLRLLKHWVLDLIGTSWHLDLVARMGFIYHVNLLLKLNDLLLMWINLRLLRLFLIFVVFSCLALRLSLSRLLGLLKILRLLLLMQEHLLLLGLVVQLVNWLLLDLLGLFSIWLHLTLNHDLNLLRLLSLHTSFRVLLVWQLLLLLNLLIQHLILVHQLLILQVLGLLLLLHLLWLARLWLLYCWVLGAHGLLSLIGHHQSRVRSSVQLLSLLLVLYELIGLRLELLLLIHLHLLHLLLLIGSRGGLLEYLLLHLLLLLSWLWLLLLCLALWHECLLHLLVVGEHVVALHLLVGLMEIVLLLFQVLLDFCKVQRDVLTVSISLGSLDERLLLFLLDVSSHLLRLLRHLLSFLLLLLLLDLLSFFFFLIFEGVVSRV